MDSNEFCEKLEDLINRYSMENGSNTPDFVLAEYLMDCLRAFDKATNKRSEWQGDMISTALEDAAHRVER